MDLDRPATRNALLIGLVVGIASSLVADAIGNTVGTSILAVPFAAVLIAVLIGGPSLLRWWQRRQIQRSTQAALKSITLTERIVGRLEDHHNDPFSLQLHLFSAILKALLTFAVILCLLLFCTGVYIWLQQLMTFTIPPAWQSFIVGGIAYGLFFWLVVPLVEARNQIRWFKDYEHQIELLRLDLDQLSKRWSTTPDVQQSIEALYAKWPHIRVVSTSAPGEVTIRPQT